MEQLQRPARGYVLADLLSDEGVKDCEINSKIGLLTDAEVVEVYRRHGYDPFTEAPIRKE